jgi:hypothetical protein
MKLTVKSSAIEKLEVDELFTVNFISEVTIPTENINE